MPPLTTPTARRWAQIIERCEASDLSNRAFAKKNGLNHNTLSWWKGRINRMKDASKEPAFITVIGIETQSTDETIDIRIETLKAIIPVRKDTDLSRLKVILEALC